MIEKEKLGVYGESKVGHLGEGVELRTFETKINIC